jgi:hypothetical protein
MVYRVLSERTLEPGKHRIRSFLSFIYSTLVSTLFERSNVAFPEQASKRGTADATMHHVCDITRVDSFAW